MTLSNFILCLETAEESEDKLFPSPEFVCLWFNCRVLNKGIKFWHVFLGLLEILDLHTPLKLSASCQEKALSFTTLCCGFESWLLVCSYHERSWETWQRLCRFFVIRLTNAFLIPPPPPPLPKMAQERQRLFSLWTVTQLHVGLERYCDNPLNFWWFFGVDERGACCSQDHHWGALEKPRAHS